MAEANLVTQEEMALRRRARRRLVGAVAIALTAFVAVPMLFDSEPKPLGPDVDLRIPAKDSPFETGNPGAVPAGTAPVAPEPPARSAEPTDPPAQARDRCRADAGRNPDAAACRPGRQTRFVQA